MDHASKTESGHRIDASTPDELDLLRMVKTQRIVLATHNAGKLAEFKVLFAELPFTIDFVSSGELGLSEPVEDGTTYIENARIKAHAAAKASGMLALADDSGMALEALGGAPGVYTADWAETGNGRDWSMAMRKAEDALQAAGAVTRDQRRCVFSSTLCLAHPDGRDLIVEGWMPGTYVWPPRGVSKVGFDPAFEPEGSALTYGELNEVNGKFGFLTHRLLSVRKFSGMLSRVD